MITSMLSDEAKAYLKVHADRLERETQEWLDRDLGGPCPTLAIEQMLLSELIDCLGMKMVRPMIECLAPDGGWPASSLGTSFEAAEHERSS